MKKIRRNTEESVKELGEIKSKPHPATEPHILFSSENPYHDQEVYQTYDQVSDALKKRGMSVENIEGKYGNPERSYMVKNPTKDDFNFIKDSARKLGQDSIILSNGKNHVYLFVNGDKAGKYHKGEGTQFHENEPEDFYTKMPDGSFFTHNIDFDNLYSNPDIDEFFLNKSEEIVIFGDITLLSIDFVDEEHLLEKTRPLYEGQAHPTEPWEAKVHSSGELMWHANKDQISRIQRMIQDPSLHDRVLSRLPKTHHVAYKRMVIGVLKDPDRYFIPSQEGYGGEQRVRARHLRGLLLDHPSIKLDASHPDWLVFNRKSDTRGTGDKEISIRFPTATGGKSGKEKAPARNDGSRVDPSISGGQDFKKSDFGGARIDLGASRVGIGADSRSFLNEDTNQLMNRVEDKFFLPVSKLQEFTAFIKEKLRAGDIDTSVRYNTNRTIYLDNIDLDCFRDNLSGIKPRFKIRIRQYKPNNSTWEETSYLELKVKTTNGTGEKTRIRIPNSLVNSVCNGAQIKIDNQLELLNKDLSKSALASRVLAINTIVEKYGLKKQVVVEYHRRSFSGKKVRISIDDSLKYYDFKSIEKTNGQSILDSDEWKGIYKTFKKIRNNDFLILEIKHEEKLPDWLKKAIKKMKIKPVSFSKYCASIISHLTNGYAEKGIIQRQKIDFNSNESIDVLKSQSNRGSALSASEKIKSDLRRSDGKNNIQKNIPRIKLPNQKGISSRPDQEVYPVNMWSGKSRMSPITGQPWDDYLHEKIKTSGVNQKYQRPMKTDESKGYASELSAKNAGLGGIFIPSEKKDIALVGRNAEDYMTEHEGFHLLSEQILKKYGHDAHTKFLDSLIDKIHPEVKKQIHDTLSKVDSYQRMLDPNVNPRYRNAYKEEMINLVRDWCAGGKRRNVLKDQFGINPKGKSLTNNSSDEVSFKDFDNKTKKSWKSIINHSKNYQFNAHQDDALVASERIEPDLRKNIVKNEEKGVNNYSNWTHNSDQDIENEYNWEYKNHWDHTNLFPTLDHFKQAMAKAKVVKIPPEMDDKIGNRSFCSSVKELKDLTGSYRFPRDVDKIVNGFKNNHAIPHPIVIKKNNRYTVMSGNTRMDAARIHGIKPHVALIDLDETTNDSVNKNEFNLKKGSLQRKNPFNPNRDVSYEDASKVRDWQIYEGTREDVPSIKGNARARALHKLHSKTEVRKHPETGERMFLLYRGINPDETNEQRSSRRSSWTPHLHAAKDFALNAGDRGKVISAWIPESQIHNIPSQLGSLDNEGGTNEFSAEHEVIVKPHNFIYAKRQKLKPSQVIDKKINKRAEKAAGKNRKATIHTVNLEDMTASEKDTTKVFNLHPRKYYASKKAKENKKAQAEKERKKTGAKKPLDAALDKLKIEKAEPPKYKTGDRVVHPKLGAGTVRQNHNDGHLTVGFDSGGSSLSYKGQKIHHTELKQPMKKNISKSTSHEVSDLKKGSLQRKIPFSPSQVSEKERQQIGKWIEGESPSAKKNIPEMDSNLKRRMLNRFGGYTQTRKNPETGETEYLLHRGMGTGEYKKLKSKEFNKDYMSSWTPDISVARSFEDANEAVTGGTVVSAWIPESQVHHIPMGVGDVGMSVGVSKFAKQSDLDLSSPVAFEKEVLVKPHRLNLLDPNQKIPEMMAAYEKNPETLHGLSDYGSKGVLDGLSKNPFTSTRTLDKIVKTGNLATHNQVFIAGHRNVSAEALHKLSESNNSAVIGRVMGNKKVSPITLDKLADHSDPMVVQKVCTHPKTSVETLNKVLDKNNLGLSRAVALRQNLSLDVLNRLSEIPDDFIASKILQNENVSPEILQKLTNHKDPYIASEAKELLKSKTL